MNYKIRKRQTKNIYIVFLTYISDSLHLTSYFGPRVYPLGSLVIALVRPCDRPSLNILGTAH